MVYCLLVKITLRLSFKIKILSLEHIFLAIYWSDCSHVAVCGAEDIFVAMGTFCCLAKVLGLVLFFDCFHSYLMLILL